ncbi:CRISP-associated protein Cas1 [Solimonas aquatica]|uniref:CRISPR-associated endonuclease Cas1 n=1 Tax=Solimonas aquatica TaxID=489703 RepID=A0A1H9LTY3_9GAMM|nr:type II CRISPR-associated endonuclease Cas1 [Solimonas aquatica]SER14884.1 CRISP-associated protein Cas1 [Solimonas aquatica]
MSEHRILLIENPARLSVDLGRIRICRENEKDIFVAPGDIAVMVLHHHTVELTAQTLQLLVENRAIVLLTDSKHHPSGWLTPMYGLPQATLRLRQQLELATDTRKRLWQSIIQSRIRTEANTLRELSLNGALRLERMATEVMPGDESRHEGQAAKHYWDCLFGKGFKRDKQGAEDLTNAALNFGYAVLRSLVARELAVASLTPMLGIGHSSGDNSYNLADDFIEPYRHLVERLVFEQHDSFGEFDAKARLAVLGLIKKTVRLGNMEFRLPAAVRETVASYLRILETGRGGLALPC